jgi:hypothetical protein
MTKRQRSQVVKLLRCAADNAAREVFLPLITAVKEGGFSPAISQAAFDVYRITFQEQPASVEHDRECAALLEAAARVEEGRWP